MPKHIDENDEPKFLLGSEFRDAVGSVITRVIPNIQHKQLIRLVAEFTVEIDHLHELAKEDGAV